MLEIEKSSSRHRKFVIKEKRPKDILGEEGEKQAIFFLKKKRFHILGQNIEMNSCEIDIVAKKKDELIFVEVKTRRSDAFGQPYEAVNYKRQKKMLRAVREFIRYYRIFETPYRFDIISIVWPEGENPRIEHLERAFHFDIWTGKIVQNYQRTRHSRKLGPLFSDSPASKNGR